MAIVSFPHFTFLLFLLASGFPLVAFKIQFFIHSLLAHLYLGKALLEYFHQIGLASVSFFSLTNEIALPGAVPCRLFHNF